MKCHEAKRHLDLFMDGELSVQENLTVLEHLNLCRGCAGVYEGEKALRAALRSRLGSESAPAGLSERLLGSLEQGAGAPPSELRPLPAPSASRRRWLYVSAAAVFFLVVFSIVSTSLDEKPGAFASELENKHDQTRLGFCGEEREDCVCLCAKCCDDLDATMTRFFQHHVSYSLCGHEFKELGYKPYGASVWTHHGRSVCWIVFRDERGHIMTHGLVTTKLAMEGKPLFLDGRRPVVMIPEGDSGRTCAFTFDDETEARRFREALHLR